MLSPAGAASNSPDSGTVKCSKVRAQGPERKQLPGQGVLRVSGFGARLPLLYGKDSREMALCVHTLVRARTLRTTGPSASIARL